MRIDELVDGGLVLRIEFVELQPHAVAAIAPRDVALGIDVPFRARKAKPEANVRAALERAGRPDGDSSAADVRVQPLDGCEPVSIEASDARASASIEIIGNRSAPATAGYAAPRVFVSNTARKRATRALLACYRTRENQNRQAPISSVRCCGSVDPGRGRERRSMTAVECARSARTERAARRRF